MTCLPPPTEPARRAGPLRNQAVPISAEELARLRDVNAEFAAALERIVGELPNYGLGSHAMYIQAVSALAEYRGELTRTELAKATGKARGEA